MRTMDGGGKHLSPHIVITAIRFRLITGYTFRIIGLTSCVLNICVAYELVSAPPHAINPRESAGSRRRITHGSTRTRLLPAQVAAFDKFEPEDVTQESSISAVPRY